MAYKQPYGMKDPIIFGKIKDMIQKRRDTKEAEANMLRNKARVKNRDNEGDSYVSIQRYKPEEKGATTQYYDTYSTLPQGQGEIIKRELNLKYSRQKLKDKAKAQGEKSPRRQMREHIRELRPDFKGFGVGKKTRLKWKDKANQTGGIKNAIKNRYGFGKSNIDEGEQTTHQTGTSFCSAAGNCNQLNK
tara:strand:+ start:334 stop:900 length:567 start_codon:yes stop_codon:yes gene_type:complete